MKGVGRGVLSMMTSGEHPVSGALGPGVPSFFRAAYLGGEHEKTLRAEETPLGFGNGSFEFRLWNSGSWNVGTGSKEVD